MKKKNMNLYIMKIKTDYAYGWTNYDIVSVTYWKEVTK